MEKKTFKKVVLAYSGGLDTSIIISWLKENYGWGGGGGSCCLCVTGCWRT